MTYCFEICFFVKFHFNNFCLQNFYFFIIETLFFTFLTEAFSSVEYSWWNEICISCLLWKTFLWSELLWIFYISKIVTYQSLWNIKLLYYSFSSFSLWYNFVLWIKSHVGNAFASNWFRKFGHQIDLTFLVIPLNFLVSRSNVWINMQ